MAVECPRATRDRGFADQTAQVPVVSPIEETFR